jgi:hypothetical protein
MRLLPRWSRFLPMGRSLVALVVLLSATAALAVCQPPDASLDWTMVGEIVQNKRTRSARTYAITPWSTVDSVANLGAFSTRETLSASFSENRIVSFTIERWGLGTNSASSRTHRVTLNVAPGSRARLLRQQREEILDLSWDVVCAWLHRVTGASAITPYGFGYRGTTWRVYDAFDVRSEPL